MRTNDRKSTVLYCNCSYSQIIPEDTKQGVQALLTQSGKDIIAVPDLCALAARRDPSLERLAVSESLTIAACYPRAVRWLFCAAGVSLPETVEFLNMRTQTANKIKSAQNNAFSFPPVEKDGEWVPWFPVIDYQRCKNCKQCVSF